ncbi:hypothetical protein QFC22_004748 [Naganishia vaughanmartiniae]|uniref:Uncharacterized protein n=1 Tax=Naganishia vaughanmartiniae TaxID=1424756 RepID=A0ACC2WXS2_9TREE|nr:hypothetical protein QFC22_004748 [Naganishia vaughanmartiniae]
MPASQPIEELKLMLEGKQSSNTTEPSVLESAASSSNVSGSSEATVIPSSGVLGSVISEIPPSSTETNTTSSSDIPAPSPTESVSSQAPDTSSEFDPFGLYGPSPTTSSFPSSTTPDPQDSPASTPSATYITVTQTPASVVTPAVNQAFTPLGVNGKAAPAGVSYVIDPKPAVVTLQVGADGKLVPAGSAATAYSIALPGVSGLPGVQGKTAADVDADEIANAALNAPNLHYANPLMNLASEIVILTQPKNAGCNMPCLPFRTNIVKCNTDFPLLTADLSKHTTMENQKTNTSLSACICEPFIQRGSCEACLAKNSTLAAMPQMAYFSGINNRCPTVGQPSAVSSARITLPSIASNPDGTTASVNALQGVDRQLLAAVCNGTGLANSDPKTYDSCKNGLNVAAILNTTDDMLRQKIPAWKGSLNGKAVASSSSPSSSSSNGTEEETVASYCNIVHFNDFFWHNTCNGAVGSLHAAESRLMLAAVVFGAGVWLLV